MSDYDEPRYSPPVSTDVEGDDMPPNIPHVPIAGNTSDDDGVALDKFFEAMPAGPQEFEGAVPTPEDLPQTHRLLSRTLPVTNEPIMFFPADPRRTDVSFQVSPYPLEDESAGIQIASSKSECYGAAIYHADTLHLSNGYTGTGQVFSLGDYTGPIWIKASHNMTVVVSVWCVTF